MRSSLTFAVLVPLLLAPFAAPVRAAELPPAPGGAPLVRAAERAAFTGVGRVLDPRILDAHGWTAVLAIEKVLRGKLASGQRVRIGWEELARERPPRFRAGDRILVALDPLPWASLWRSRFPQGDAYVVAAGGDAFLRAPDPVSIERLGAYLALGKDERRKQPGMLALARIVRDADPALAEGAVGRLAHVPGLDQKLEARSAAVLQEALSDPRRPERLRRDLLSLIERRRLARLRPAVEKLTRPGSGLRAEALSVLATLDGGLPRDRVEALARATDPKLRAVAVREAGGTALAERLPQLVRADPAPEVRAAAVTTLLRLRGAQAIDAVEPALFDADASVRLAAVQGLAALGEAAIPRLSRLAEGGHLPEVRAPLAALAIAGPRGREALARVAARHPDEQVRALARFFLGMEPRKRH